MRIWNKRRTQTFHSTLKRFRVCPTNPRGVRLTFSGSTAMSAQNFSMASGPTTLSGPAYLWNQARHRLLENCLSWPSVFTLQSWGWVKLQHRQKASVRPDGPLQNSTTERFPAETRQTLCSRHVYLVILHLWSWSSGSFLFFTGIVEPLLDLSGWASREKKKVEYNKSAYISFSPSQSRSAQTVRNCWWK